MNKITVIILLVALAIASCKESDPPAPLDTELKEGVFIVNQGTFTAVNATLTYYETGDRSMIKELFKQVNGAPLGDVAQSITMDDTKAWIVMNNSGVVYGINRSDAKLTGTISGLMSPRHLLMINEDKAYVSDFFSRNIAIVNPKTYQVTGQISTPGRGTEEMVLVDKFAYAANWSGYNQPKLNNMILVVDTDSDKVTDSIQVGIEPNSLVVDKNENIWVLCSGGFELETKKKPTLWKIDPATKQVTDTITFAQKEMWPSALELGHFNDTLFFLNAGIFKMGIDEESVPDDEFIKEDNGRNYEYLAVDPVNGDIYTSDPLDYISNGNVYQFSSKGLLIKTLTDVGIVPGSFGFNH